MKTSIAKTKTGQNKRAVRTRPRAQAFRVATTSTYPKHLGMIATFELGPQVLAVIRKHDVRHRCHRDLSPLSSFALVGGAPAD